MKWNRLKSIFISSVLCCLLFFAALPTPVFAYSESGLPSLSNVVNNATGTYLILRWKSSGNWRYTCYQMELGTNLIYSDTDADGSSVLGTSNYTNGTSVKFKSSVTVDYQNNIVSTNTDGSLSLGDEWVDFYRATSEYTIASTNMPVYSSYTTQNASTLLYGTSYNLISKTLYYGQQINISYTAANKSNFMYSIDTNDGACVQFAYATNGVQDTQAGQIIWDSYLNRIDKADVNTFDALGTDEWLLIRNQITGNSTADSLTVQLDQNKCTWYISNVNTGTVVDNGNATTTPTPGTIPVSGIPGQDVFPDDDALQRSQYPEGLEGTISYYMDNLFKWLSMPLRVLAQFFTLSGSLISTGVASVTGLTTATQALYAVMPASLVSIFTLAVAISIFKLLFGR